MLMRSRSDCKLPETQFPERSLIFHCTYPETLDRAADMENIWFIERWRKFFTWNVFILFWTFISSFIIMEGTWNWNLLVDETVKAMLKAAKASRKWYRWHMHGLIEQKDRNIESAIKSTQLGKRNMGNWSEILFYFVLSQTFLPYSF